MDTAREFTMKAGRRVQDGTVSLSAFLPGVLSLSVSRKAERAGTVQLTREQARRLRQALAELELMIEPEGEARSGRKDSSDVRTASPPDAASAMRKAIMMMMRDRRQKVLAQLEGGA